VIRRKGKLIDSRINSRDKRRDGVLGAFEMIRECRDSRVFITFVCSSYTTVFSTVVKPTILKTHRIV
jgi:hypothetical protein